MYEKQRGKRQDHENLDDAIDQHGIAPAPPCNSVFENDGPQKAGDIVAAGKQGERGSAPAVKPVADIDIQRGVETRNAEQADEHAMADIQLPGLSQGGDIEADEYHQPAADDRPAHTEPLRQPTH